MIFCNTKKMVDEVVEALSIKKFKAQGLHGDISQHERTKIMNDFKKGLTNILVCSDVAARGIDVNDVEFVINYDLPYDREYYTHRIGRTGRAGKNGVAISILTSSRHLSQIKQYAEYTNQELVCRILPTKDEIYETHVNKFLDEISMNQFDDITNLDKFDELKKEIVKRLYQTNLIKDEIIYFLLGKILFLPDFKEVFNKVKKEKTVEKKSKAAFNRSVKMSTLKIKMGKINKLRPNHIVCAIVEETSLKANEIGKIVIQDTFCLVDVAQKKEKEVMDSLSKVKINKTKVVISKVK
jgi:ATP-dependent RNA helicase DeaD